MVTKVGPKSYKVAGNIDISLEDTYSFKMGMGIDIEGFGGIRFKDSGVLKLQKAGIGKGFNITSTPFYTSYSDTKR
jgi:hypothetical protein